MNAVNDSPQDAKRETRDVGREPRATSRKPRNAKRKTHEETEEAAAARRARKAKLDAIAREFEQKKRELGLRAPAIKRGPMFYLVVLLALFCVGGAVLQMAGKGGGRKGADAKLLHAQQSVDAIAEALGRFKFHTGKYPTADDGLFALFRNDTRYQSRYPGWMGRYLQPKDVSQNPVPDPWKRQYRYAPPQGTNGFPVVRSLGPDGILGTADDVVPNPEAFMRPFNDVTWTNDWAHFWQRGFIVRPHGN